MNITLTKCLKLSKEAVSKNLELFLILVFFPLSPTSCLGISANKIFKNSALEISFETISKNGLGGVFAVSRLFHQGGDNF